MSTVQQLWQHKHKTYHMFTIPHPEKPCSSIQTELINLISRDHMDGWAPPTVTGDTSHVKIGPITARRRSLKQRRLRLRPFLSTILSAGFLEVDIWNLLKHTGAFGLRCGRHGCRKVETTTVSSSVFWNVVLSVNQVLSQHFTILERFQTIVSLSTSQHLRDKWPCLMMTFLFLSLSYSLQVWKRSQRQWLTCSQSRCADPGAEKSSSSSSSVSASSCRSLSPLRY